MLKTLWLAIAIVLSSMNQGYGATSWVATPSSIVLTAAPSQTGIKQVVTVTNTSTTSVTVVWADPVDFIHSVSPVSLAVPANSSAKYTASMDIVTPYNCTGGCPMVAGVYSGAVTLTGGGVTQVIPVSLTIGTVAVTKPAKVLGLTVVSNTSVALQWTPNIESDLASYNVYVRTAATGYTTGTNVVGVTYATTGLLSKTTYFFVVTAVDTAGNESGHSNEVSLTTF